MSLSIIESLRSIRVIDVALFDVIVGILIPSYFLYIKMTRGRKTSIILFFILFMFFLGLGIIVHWMLGINTVLNQKILDVF
jgi:hypothetical protein